MLFSHPRGVRRPQVRGERRSPCPFPALRTGEADRRAHDDPPAGRRGATRRLGRARPQGGRDKSFPYSPQRGEIVATRGGGVGTPPTRARPRSGRSPDLKGPAAGGTRGTVQGRSGRRERSDRGVWGARRSESCRPGGERTASRRGEGRAPTSEATPASLHGDERSGAHEDGTNLPPEALGDGEPQANEPRTAEDGTFFAERANGERSPARRAAGPRWAQGEDATAKGGKNEAATPSRPRPHTHPRRQHPNHADLRSRRRAPSGREDPPSKRHPPSQRRGAPPPEPLIAGHPTRGTIKAS